MIYKWKLNGLYSVDAQTAGEELERIYEKRGALKASDIVDESREESAPLHKCFEWDDTVAAEKYREGQAGEIVRFIVSVSQDTRGTSEIRAFVHVESAYHPMTIVLRHESMKEELLQSAYRDSVAYRKKHSVLSELLQPVFEAFDGVFAEGGKCNGSYQISQGCKGPETKADAAAITQVLNQDGNGFPGPESKEAGGKNRRVSADSEQLSV